MRRFYDPMARALIEQRRDLLWSPENGRRVTQVLRAVTNHPEEVVRQPAGVPGGARGDPPAGGGAAGGRRSRRCRTRWPRRSGRRRCRSRTATSATPKERLAKAKERLQQALREGAPDDEIARLMDELRQATRDYMDQMARDTMQNGEMQQAEIPPGQTMTQDQIQELMDRIQELSEQGQQGRGRGAAGDAAADARQHADDDGPAGRRPGRERPGAAVDAGPRRRAARAAGAGGRQLPAAAARVPARADGQQGQGQDGQPGEQDGPGGQAQGGDDGSLADRQEALRRLTEELQRGLPGEAGEAARQALREAERNMGDARDGLREGDTAGALDRQADAIDSLREGMRQMGEDLRRAEGTGQGEQGQVEGSATAEDGRDPLGRPSGGARRRSAPTRTWCPRRTARRGRGRSSTRSAAGRASRCGRSSSSTTCGGCSTCSKPVRATARCVTRRLCAEGSGIASRPIGGS